MSKVPPGGPATIAGVVYQMLWSLLRISRFEVKDLDAREDGNFDSTFLVLEPDGGGGDAQEISGGRRVATQVKSRSNGGTWSLREVVQGVFPDLLKAVIDGPSEQSFEFVTNGRRGDWIPVEKFFNSLNERPLGCEVMANLDDKTPIPFSRGRPPGDATHYWDKESYTELDLFNHIAKSLEPDSGDANPAHSCRVWKLLANFRFKEVPDESAIIEIDDWIEGRIDFKEDIPEKRNSLLMHLANLARSGNARIDLADICSRAGMTALPSKDTRPLLDRARTLIHRRTELLKFTPVHHVQDSITNELADRLEHVHLLTLAGPSGSGKSWHSCALARELTRRGSFVAHIDCRSSAKDTLDDACRFLWNQIKGHDQSLLFEKVAERFPGPPPLRTLIVDNVNEATVARYLTQTDLESHGLRLVLCCNQEAVDAVVESARENHSIHEVADFTSFELEEYLSSRGIPDSGSIPSDVREVLRRPLFAHLFCSAYKGTSWNPKNEYDLIHRHWERTLAKNPRIKPTIDLAFLAALGHRLLKGDKYPWTSQCVTSCLSSEDSLKRLQANGWLTSANDGSCSVWHNRLLNWLIATTLANDLSANLDNLKGIIHTLGEAVEGKLNTTHCNLGYLALDFLWLLVHKGVNCKIIAEVLKSLETAVKSGAFYRELVPTLGDGIAPSLLLRLEQMIARESNEGTFEIASCLASIDSPEIRDWSQRKLRGKCRESRAIALQILKKQGCPEALDTLWEIHISAETERNIPEYCLRMDAISAALSVNSSWLGQRLKGATRATPRLTDLIYSIPKALNGRELWQSNKKHLLGLLPQEKTRCLLQCIRTFHDVAELDFVHNHMTEKSDLVGETALATLARLDPDEAVNELEFSRLQMLSFSKSWHIHPLLIARPEATQAAILKLAKAQSLSELSILYQGAENEIDTRAFDLALDNLEDSLAKEINEGVDPNSGRLYIRLSFVLEVVNPDLLARLFDRKGKRLANLLEQYLRSVILKEKSLRGLSAGFALRLLQRTGSDALPDIINSGLQAPSQPERTEALQSAFKQHNEATITLLRSLALSGGDDDNSRYEAYLAVNALCHLKQWELVIEIVEALGLHLSPYLLECRRGQPTHTSPIVERLLKEASEFSLTPGKVLAIGLTQDSRFIEPLTTSLSNSKGNHEILTATFLALDLLGADGRDVVNELAAHLAEPSLRDRVAMQLIAIGTQEALDSLMEHLTDYFDLTLCAKVGNRKEYAHKAAELIWENLDKSRVSSGSSQALVTLGEVHKPEVEEFLEKIAFGDSGRLSFRDLRFAAIKGLSKMNRRKAYRASVNALINQLEIDRSPYPMMLMNIDEDQAIPLLLERSKVETDEPTLIAIADALAEVDINRKLEEWITDNDPNSRRAACLLSSRRPLTNDLRAELRKRALDIDERVAQSASHAVREEIRSLSTQALCDRIEQGESGQRKWAIIDLIVTAARGTRTRPPIRRALLASLADRLSPLEIEYLNSKLKKGANEYRRNAKRR